MYEPPTVRFEMLEGFEMFEIQSDWFAVRLKPVRFKAFEDLNLQGLNLPSQTESRRLPWQTFSANLFQPICTSTRFGERLVVQGDRLWAISCQGLLIHLQPDSGAVR
jgi:hypothetical protein